MDILKLLYSIFEPNTIFPQKFEKIEDVHLVLMMPMML